MLAQSALDSIGDKVVVSERVGEGEHRRSLGVLDRRWSTSTTPNRRHLHLH